jgi:hypothetical protein
MSELDAVYIFVYCTQLVIATFACILRMYRQTVSEWAGLLRH